MSQPVAPAHERTQAPPERRIARVTGVERLGGYRLVSALDESGPRAPRPGQFYMLASELGWGGGSGERPYLPRAFSYARASRAGRGLRLDFLLEEVGPGTERLAALKAGEGLGLVGPLGIGFRPPAPGTRPLLVGGGIGAAPLVCLQDELAGARGPGTVLLGFRSADYVATADLFAGGSVAVATDDGSAGRAALVTELLREELDRDAAVTVFSCGPPAMLEAVRALCVERSVPAQLALEAGMACGFGACFGCVVPTTDGYLRLCVDGPVLDADRLEPAGR